VAFLSEVASRVAAIVRNHGSSELTTMTEQRNDLREGILTGLSSSSDVE
jgi:hypothetical protein